MNEIFTDINITQILTRRIQEDWYNRKNREESLSIKIIKIKWMLI